MADFTTPPRHPSAPLVKQVSSFISTESFSETVSFHLSNTDTSIESNLVESHQLSTYYDDVHLMIPPSYTNINIHLINNNVKPVSQLCTPQLQPYSKHDTTFLASTGDTVFGSSGCNAPRRPAGEHSRQRRHYSRLRSQIDKKERYMQHALFKSTNNSPSSSDDSDNRTFKNRNKRYSAERSDSDSTEESTFDCTNSDDAKKMAVTNNVCVENTSFLDSSLRLPFDSPIFLDKGDLEEVSGRPKYNVRRKKRRYSEAIKSEVGCQLFADDYEEVTTPTKEHDPSFNFLHFHSHSEINELMAQLTMSPSPSAIQYNRGSDIDDSNTTNLPKTVIIEPMVGETTRSVLSIGENNHTYPIPMTKRISPNHRQGMAGKKRSMRDDVGNPYDGSCEGDEIRCASRRQDFNFISAKFSSFRQI
eukprot:Tbor_TRINITY_DN3165_c0_g1::TRINITY_DN3165_c0_g1_i1::g.14737::m.14737